MFAQNFIQLLFAEVQYWQNLVIQIEGYLSMKNSLKETSQTILVMSGRLKINSHK